MASLQLEKTKKNIRSVLTSCKEGVPASRFQLDYRSLAHHSGVQYQAFGFSTLHEFIISIPDVVQVSNRGGGITYHAVASEETQHIQNMVAKQASKKKKKKTTSYKCLKPYQRINASFKHCHGGPPRLRKGLLGSRPNQTLVRKMHNQPKPRMQYAQTSGFRSERPSMKVTVERNRRHCDIFQAEDKSKKWTSKVVNCSTNSSTSLIINHVIKNRIRTILGQNPMGVFSNNLPTLYLREYGCELSQSVVYELEAGAICDVARIEKMTRGSREKYILFPIGKDNTPIGKQKNQCSDKSDSAGLDGVLDKFSIDTKTNKMTISERMEKSIKSLLCKHTAGITFNDFKKVCEDDFGCQIPDSVLYGLECGQIENLAKVVTKKFGHREIITFYPWTPQEPARPKSLLRPPDVGDDFSLDTIVKTRIKRILETHPKGIKLSKLGRIYSEAFKDVLNLKTVNCIKEGALKEFIGIKAGESEDDVIFLIEREKQSSRPRKYPGIETKTSGKVFTAKTLAIGSEHEVFITHIESCDRFCVQLDMHAKENKEPKGATNYHNNPELDILCSLQKYNANSPWSVRASNRFHQLCLEKMATIKVITVEKKTIDQDSKDVHVVTCCFGSFDINMRLMMENSSLVEITGANIFDSTKTTEEQELKDKIPVVTETHDEKSTSGDTRSSPTLTKEFDTLSNHTSDGARATAIRSKQLLSNEYPRNISPQNTCSKNPQVNNVNVTKLQHDTKIVSNDEDGIVGRETMTVNSVHGQEQKCRIDKIETTSTPQKNSEETPIDQGNVEQPTYVISPIEQPFPVREFGKFIHITVTRVVSPGKFYMVPVERVAILESLTAIMNTHYNNTKVADAELGGGGSLYAAPVNIDGIVNWRRVSLKNIVSSFASVFLVDIGALDCVPIHSLRKLKSEFAYLPTLAMIGRLAGIKPKDMSAIESVTKLFENLVLGRRMIAHLTKTSVVKNSMVFDVCLCIENDDGDGYGQWINDTMVEEWKVAEYICEI